MQTIGNTLISRQLIQVPDYFAFVRKWDVRVRNAYLGQYSMQTSGNTLISRQLIQVPDYFVFVRKWDVRVKNAYWGQYCMQTSGNTLIGEHTPIPLRRGRVSPNTLVPMLLASIRTSFLSSLVYPEKSSSNDEMCTDSLKARMCLGKYFLYLINLHNLFYIKSL